jgi:hypothetical protein
LVALKDLIFGVVVDITVIKVVVEGYWKIRNGRVQVNGEYLQPHADTLEMAARMVREVATGKCMLKGRKRGCVVRYVETKPKTLWLVDKTGLDGL